VTGPPLLLHFLAKSIAATLLLAITRSAGAGLPNGWADQSSQIQPSQSSPAYRTGRYFLPFPMPSSTHLNANSELIVHLSSNL
jgi:hypothetical protein